MSPFNIEVPFKIHRIKVLRKASPMAYELPTETRPPLPPVLLGPPAPQEETLYDGTYDAGIREGRRLAFAEMAAARASETREVQEAVRELSKVLEELINVAEGHLPQLIVSTLDRIFREHAFTSDEIAKEVAALLREAVQAQSITVESAPDDISLLERRIEALGLSLQQGRVQWKANPTLTKGEYLLQTDLGTVDGRRLSKLAQVRLALES